MENVKFIHNYKVIEFEKTNIYIIEDVIDSSFCNYAIDIINILNLRKNDYGVGNNVKCYVNHIDSLLKLDDSLFYKFSTDSHKYEKILNELKSTNILNGLIHEDIENLRNKINQKMEILKDIMKEINNTIVIESNTGYCLRKIYGKTRNHIDNISEIYNSNITFINKNKMGDYRMVRNASIIMQLNDDYEGGEFKFTYHDIKIKLKKGSILIFPPFWTHPHETEELINETFRYTINTWSCEKIN